jgi:hypothetical protein
MEMTQHGYFRDSAVRGGTNQYPAPDPASAGCYRVDAGKHCAYNQSRQRFLSAEVDAADFSPASLDVRLPDLAASPDASLWLVPFRGISPTSVRVPVDLIYLDLHCAVLDTVESFPLARVSSSSPSSATVLVLPAGAIRATETRRGDQLILCPPEEMKRHLQQLNDATPQPMKESQSRGAAGRVLQWEDRARSRDSAEPAAVEEGNRLEPASERAPSAPEPDATGATEPAQKSKKPAKSWLQRLLAIEPPDPRRTARESLPGLAAYFFTGGTPVAHSVRDVSVTGVYVLTTERWYLGTMVRITLTDSQEPTLERSITLNATVVRWGNDGVGLRFILQEGKARQAAGPDAIQVDQFLQRLRSS